MERPQIIVANKMDMPGAEENLKEFKEKLAANYDEFDELPQIFPISSLAHQGLENLLEATAELLDETDEFLLYSEDDMEQEEVYYALTRMNAHLKLAVMTMPHGYFLVRNLKNSLS